MNWTIYAFGGGDFFAVVFNAIAMIFGNDDYLVAMNIAALLGFLGVLLKAAIDKDGLANFKWLVVLIVFYMGAIVPKQTVVIIDKYDAANTTVVDNVPLGIAATAGMVSQFSNWMTEEFDTVFAIPGMGYSQNNALYGLALLDAVTQTRFSDGVALSNFNRFFATCIVLDAIPNNRMLLSDSGNESLLSTGNVHDYVMAHVAQNVAFFSAADGSVQSCRDGYQSHVYDVIVATGVDAALLPVARRVLPFMDPAAGVAKIRADFNGIANSLTGIDINIDDAVAQAMQVNAMQGAARLSLLVAEGSPDIVNDIMSAKAEAARDMTFRDAGVLAAAKLPMLKMLFEAFIYAIFPIVVLMAIISPAKVSLAYLKAVIWIGMWAPIYALLNFAFVYFSQDAHHSIVTANSIPSGLSYAVITALHASISETASTASYLFLSIPMIAWMFVSQSGAMMASLAGRAMQVDTSPTPSPAPNPENTSNMRSSQSGYGEAVNRASTYHMQNDASMLQSNYNAPMTPASSAALTDMSDRSMASQMKNDVGGQQTNSNNRQALMSQASELAPNATHRAETLNAVSAQNTVPQFDDSKKKLMDDVGKSNSNAEIPVFDNHIWNQGGNAAGGVVRAREIASFNPVQRAAYDSAYHQNVGHAKAMEVGRMVGLKQDIEKEGQRLQANATKDPASWAQYQQKLAAFNDGLLAYESYFDKSIPQLMPAGVHRMSDAELARKGIASDFVRNEESSYFAAVYHNDKTGHYTVANRGTQELGKDMQANYEQSLGRKTAQYEQAIKLSERMQDTMGNNLSFTGHSLGGGLASAQALRTSLHATTFNSSGLHANTIGRHGISMKNSDKLINAMYVKGELLSTGQDARSVWVPLPTPYAETLSFPQLPVPIGALQTSIVKVDLPEATGKRIPLAAVESSEATGKPGDVRDALAVAASAVSEHFMTSVIDSMYRSMLPFPPQPLEK